MKNYVEYDPSAGHPAGEDLYYECQLCGGIIPSLPPDSVGCACSNLFIDKDYGRLVIRQPDSVKLFMDDGRPDLKALG